MRAWRLGVATVGCLLMLGVAACGQARAQTGAATATSPALPATIAPVTFTPTPYPRTPNPYPLPSTPSPKTPVSSPTYSPLPPALSPTPCPPDLCVYSGVFPFQRPIGPNDRQAVDPSYRFGSTQGGQRDPHHGVELLNSFGTPVLAAADGAVVVAGDDIKTLYGPYYNAYGNLVVIQHKLPGYTEPVFTVYGHLSKILVEAGQRVTAGQPIGAVGLSGAATGSHLHFEVRFGENKYKASRNPELWLAPLPGQDGQPDGALAGRILDAYGQYLKVPNIVVEYLPDRNGPAAWEAYVGTYEEKQLVGQPPWQESFALGDLPAGWYRISFVQYGMQSRLVQVLPGELTVVTFEFKQ